MIGYIALNWGLHDAVTVNVIDGSNVFEEPSPSKRSGLTHIKDWLETQPEGRDQPVQGLS